MLIAQLLLLIPLCYLSYKDAKALEIPAKITYLMVVGLFIAEIGFLALGTGIERQLALHNIIATTVTTAVLVLLYLLTKRKAFGVGDIFIIAAIALTSGLAGTLLSLAFASWLGTLYAGYYYLRFRKFKGVQIPLVPFLTVGYAISIIVLKYFLAV
jgi:prepilin signal peptidase PulO-like enzyme (type II secretory pathway)